MDSTITQRLRNPATLLAIGIALLCIILQYSDLQLTLRFDRQAIENGHWHLLLSGNFVHLGTSHLWMNMAGLGLIASLVWSQFNAWEWLVITVVSSFFVGLGLFLFDPKVFWYVGFSGTLHALIVAGSLADLKRYPKSASVLLVMVCGKLAWEQINGAMPGSESVAGGHVLVNSHLYGAIAGAVLGLALIYLKRLRTLAAIAQSQQR